ncbi:MAG: site-specific DNA-methyltransferase [Alphaproteobacteria bacterium]|nr:site-specific DNA-methyltransferase [Alphaproteobacteria bacterium]
MSVKFLVGDVLKGLRELANDSVDCVVTSPPYWNQRNYGVVGQIGLEATPQEHIEVLVNVFREVKRVLKPTGTLFVNYGDCYASSVNGRKAKDIVNDDRKFTDKPSSTVCEMFKPKDLCPMSWMLAIALQADGWWLRNDIIWDKPNAMPESVSDRFAKSHEYIFFLTKSPKYFFDMEAVKEDTVNGDPNPPRGSKGAKTMNKGRRKTFRGGGAYCGNNIDNSAEIKSDSVGNEPMKLLKRNRRTVWKVPTKGFREAHFATFPPNLIRPCILSGCPEGGIVLDPFSGAGTTALVSEQHQRNSILIELNPEYVNIAKKRIEDAGIKIENHFFSEIDKNAISIYQEHFPNAIGVGDVSTIRNVSQFGKIDLITFGFPCQDLSIAGKGRGLDGSRSGLFYEAMRLVRELKPKYFIFENVKGLLTNGGGKDFERCLREIADIGLYDCEWQLVNTSWVLPQNRERIYFIGHLRGESRPKVFPFTESDFEASRIQRKSINCLTTRYFEGQAGGSYVVENQFKEKTKSNPQGQRINTIQGNSVCLSAQGGGQGAKTGLYVVPRGNNAGGYREINKCPTITQSSFETNNFLTTNRFAEIQANCGVDLTQPNSSTRRGRLMDKNFNTITTQSQGLSWFDGVHIRRLTPVECERLQGFPDGWTDIEVSYRRGNIKRMADSARYKALGNAVTVKIVEMIARRLVA